MISANTKAATKPPTKLPSPPSTQTRKVIGPIDRPTNGWTSYISTSRQAASPASEPPSAEGRHQQNAHRRGDPIGHAIDIHEIIHPVHADHDQLGIADPGDVDHAEDQVQPERQQRQHATEQDAVDHGLEQVDVEDLEEGF